jgi:hypothetical protein
MIEVFFSFLGLITALLGFVTVIFLSLSNPNFTKGEFQKIINYFIWGTIFMFGAMASQFQVEVFNLAKTLIDAIKYIFMVAGFSCYLFASYRIYRISKVIGFASKELPEKLKKILKS